MESSRILEILVFFITTFLIWKYIKYTVTERIMLTMIAGMFIFSFIPRWIRSSNISVEDILLVVEGSLPIIIVIGLVILAGEYIKRNEQLKEEDIKQLRHQAQQPQSMSKLKTESISTIKNLVLGTFLILFLVGIFLNSAEFYNPKLEKEPFVEGYLKKGATWADEYDDVWHMNKLARTGRVHGNSELTKIEIWDNMPDKDVIVMIYFLEGRYTGRWGYTIKSFTTTSGVKKYQKSAQKK